MHILNDRALLRVAGADAFSFLQGIVTNDLSLCAGGGLAYACLLTPQGQVLADFFVWQDEAGFVLDVARDRADVLAQRLGMYRLRAAVAITRLEDLHVIAAPEKGAGDAWRKDPRLPMAGFRLYTAQPPAGAVVDEGAYAAWAVGLALPEAGAIAYGRDFPSYANLDLLHAFSWTKGCFIGQEVAARTHHRGLTKRRLVHVTGAGLEAGQSIANEKGAEVAVVRRVVADGERGVALARLADLSGAATEFLNKETNTNVCLTLPAYI